MRHLRSADASLFSRHTVPIATSLVRRALTAVLAAHLASSSSFVISRAHLVGSHLLTNTNTMLRATLSSLLIAATLSATAVRAMVGRYPCGTVDGGGNLAPDQAVCDNLLSGPVGESYVRDSTAPRSHSCSRWRVRPVRWYERVLLRRTGSSVRYCRRLRCRQVSQGARRSSRLR